MIATMRKPLLTAFLAFAAPFVILSGTARGEGFFVPKAIELPGTTPAEAKANAVWNLRAALNVAALQCQFSPFLRTVPRYNALLKQHGKELARSQLALAAYFKRKGGAGAASAFDRFNTRLYQSWSTIDAQLAFCRAASSAGFDVLAQPYGRLGDIALSEVARVRVSLTAMGEGFAPMVPPVMPDVSADLACADADRRRNRC